MFPSDHSEQRSEENDDCNNKIEKAEGEDLEAEGSKIRQLRCQGFAFRDPPNRGNFVPRQSSIAILFEDLPIDSRMSMTTFRCW